MATDEVKPCPFCGGEPRLLCEYVVTVFRFAVTCKDFQCCGFNVKRPYWESEEKAIERWNRRV